MRFAQFAILFVLATSAAADTLDDLGLTSLRERAGALLANGAGVTVAQVEAAEFGAYAPNLDNGDFSGKSFRFVGIDQQPISGHATNVAAAIYGNANGIAPSVKKVLLFSNDSFILSGGLGAGMPVLPARLRAPVINNSWVGNLANIAANDEVLRRLDYMIVRDNVFVANALDNTGAGSARVLLAAAYNGLNVGISPGLGSTFTASATTPFRLIPDLVVPVNTTSQATACVAGSAALLISEAKARKKPVSALGVRASLMAGAQRLAGWQNTSASPLDAVQGAGQLRIDRSFDILMGGEIAPRSRSRTRGWDSAVAAPKGRLFYNIILARPASGFTAALVWNRLISDANLPFTRRAATLANLDLQLQRKKGTKWVQVGRSSYTGGNVEFLAKEALIAGTYRLAVTGNRPETFALAWYTDFTSSSVVPGFALAAALAPAVQTSSDPSVVVPEPGGFLFPLALTLLACRRRGNGWIGRVLHQSVERDGPARRASTLPR